MILEYDLPSQRTTPQPLASGSTMVPTGRPPRIARLLALAHKLDEMVRQGEVERFVDLARLGHIAVGPGACHSGVYFVPVGGRRQLHHRERAPQDRARAALGSAACTV